MKNCILNKEYVLDEYCHKIVTSFICNCPPDMKADVSCYVHMNAILLSIFYISL